MKQGKVVEDGATVHGNTNKNSFTFSIVAGLTTQLIYHRDTPTLSDLTDFLKFCSVNINVSFINSKF